MWGFVPRSLVFSSLRQGRQGKSRPHSQRRNRRSRIAERLEARWLLSSDPIVTVDTNYGNFQIELSPDAAPQTVANFLQYVESGAYTDTIFHRSVPGFVEQTGGFTSSSDTFTSTSQFTTIPTNAAVPLEYKLPNITGSVAMARTSDPNSATDEWFVNLADNSTQLGPGGSDQYGYTVFGQVLGDGMQVLNAIASLSVDNADNSAGTFSELPLGANNQLAVISSITIDSIDGTVFSDTNGNGTLDTGEQGVAGRTLFVDLAGTGVYQSGDPTATTDANGDYSFSGITPGTYNVYEELPTNVTLTMPNQSVTVAANQTASGVNFAEQPSIKGEVFTDSNANGTLDSGETGVAGVTVFLNNDGSGAPDSSNPSTVTDANGNYSFSFLTPGNYTVDTVPSSGTTISTTNLSASVTSGGAAQVVNIGEVPPSIAGTVFSDVNDNGKFDTGDVGIGGRTVFINEDNSGKADGTNPQTITDSVGNFTFSGLAAGSYTVEEVLPTGGTLTTPAQTVTVTAGQTTSGVIFGELPSISGTVFADLNGNGKMDTGEPGLAGQTVFLNVDGSGKADGTNPQTTTDSSGNFAFGTEPAGSYTVEEVVPSNVTLSTSSQVVTVAAGSTTSGAKFGELPSITGTVFTDTNGNGVLDSGEAGVAGQTVYLDIDGTGAPDTSNPSTTTDSNGNYYFLGLPPGNYPVTEVVPSGVTLSTQMQTVTVTAGQITSGINIGQSGSSTTSSGTGSSTSGTSSISGTVFEDYNLDGQLDGGEPGVADRTVFLNIDGTGAPDSSNPSTTTDPNGKFTFSGLAAGTYSVEEVIPLAGSVTITTSPVSETLTAGQKATGVAIGNAVMSTVVPVAVSIVSPPATSDPNTAYVNALYEEILGRAPDAASLASWTQQLASGTSRDTVAADIWDSTEHRTAQVEQFYQDFLGRSPDASGLQFWIDSFNSWGNEQFDAADFFGSPEFQAIHSNDNTTLVNTLYSDVELRSGSSSDVTDLVNQLAGGTNQAQDWYNVIDTFVYGQEASTNVVDSFYAAFLHRAPDSSALQATVGALDSRAETADQLAIALLSSDEFFNDVTASEAAKVTSAAGTTLTEATPGTFTITTSGMPIGTITKSGNLPSGVTFTDNGDGTATLAGTPQTGSSGTYDLTLNVNNGIGTAATQNFVFTVDGVPSFTSATSASMTEGAAGSFTITTTGTPAATLSQTGCLPTGVNFTNNGDGTATLAGTPASGSAGSYDVTVIATNGVGSSVTQSLTLTVNAPANTAPTFTSATGASMVAGTGGTFTVSASGSPVPTITEAATDTPVPGVSLGTSANGSATLTVAPTAAAGTYTLNFSANNGVGSAVPQQFTLIVGTAPSFTSATSASFTAGTGGTFTVSAAGSPMPTITEAATDTPVPGVSLGTSASGSATLTVAPTAAAGTYQLNFSATNGVGSAATQPFTLTIS